MPTTSPQPTTPSPGVVYMGPSLGRSLIGVLAALAAAPNGGGPAEEPTDRPL